MKYIVVHRVGAQHASSHDWWKVVAWARSLWKGGTFLRNALCRNNSVAVVTAGNRLDVAR